MHFTRSRQSHLVGLWGLLALVGAGCGGGHARPQIQWTLADLGDPTTSLACFDAGAGDVVVTLVNLSTQATYTQTFACANYAASNLGVPNGTYSITVDLFGDPAVYGNATTLLDEVVYASTPVGGSSYLPVDFLVNSYVLGWSISSGGSPSTCARAGARFVELDIYYDGQSRPVAYTFDCTAYRDITTAIDLGSYHIQWQAFLLDAGKGEITWTQLADFNVASGAQADLGTAYFNL